MAISGSANFNLDVAEIIEEAFERCGLELRTGYDAATARRSLNLMLADWANRGINLWTVRQVTQTVAQFRPRLRLTLIQSGPLRRRLALPQVSVLARRLREQQVLLRPRS